MKFEVKKLKTENKYILWIERNKVRWIKFFLIAVIATIVLAVIFLGIMAGVQEQEWNTPLPEGGIEEVEKEKEKDALSRMTVKDVTKMYAQLNGISEDLALCILQKESSGRLDVYGDSGLAYGPFQFHLPTWRSIRKDMGLSTVDMRGNKYEATRTAMYALANGWKYHWTSYKICKMEVK